MTAPPTPEVAAKGASSRRQLAASRAYRMPACGATGGEPLIYSELHRRLSAPIGGEQRTSERAPSDDCRSQRVSVEAATHELAGRITPLSSALCRQFTGNAARRLVRDMIARGATVFWWILV